ncbi:hypothetical protein JYU34_003453 [Plutella xylostella]|uniref:Uncharacterized protein n=1 Tax=Plutella xylostella TaxID=51655 RepID=A0ABQ7R040_PLUXY|nr:hypothetical protein JYU34_003453 [Plutella xylostella]
MTSSLKNAASGSVAAEVHRSSEPPTGSSGGVHFRSEGRADRLPSHSGSRAPPPPPPQPPLPPLPTAAPAPAQQQEPRASAPHAPDNHSESSNWKCLAALCYDFLSITFPNAMQDQSSASFEANKANSKVLD